MDFKEKEYLIQALYDIGGCDAEDEWSRGYDDGVNASIEVVKELKVQGKVTAADFIKEGKGLGSDKVDIIDSAISFSRAMPDDEFSLWFKSNRDLFVDAVSNGCEVEQEPTIHELK
ncbi:RNA-binding protein, partial [Enterococcus faecalis]